MCAVPPILLAVGLWTAATGAGNAANFGAIASSPSNGAWGVSYNAATPAGANEVALNYCSGFAGDCKVVAQAAGNCAAIARAPHGHYAANGKTRQQAEAAALQQCQAAGTGCTQKLWVCTSK